MGADIFVIMDKCEYRNGRLDETVYLGLFVLRNDLSQNKVDQLTVTNGY